MALNISSRSLTITVCMRVWSSCDTKIKEYIAEIGTLSIGTEYTNKTFEHFCTNNKIKREYTVPKTPEKNGIADRYNRKAVETARCLLI